MRNEPAPINEGLNFFIKLYFTVKKTALDFLITNGLAQSQLFHFIFHFFHLFSTVLKQNMFNFN